MTSGLAIRGPWASLVSPGPLIASPWHSKPLREGWTKVAGRRASAGRGNFFAGRRASSPIQSPGEDGCSGFNERRMMSSTPRPGRHCHSTLPLAVTRRRSVGICTLILLRLLLCAVRMAVPPVARRALLDHLLPAEARHARSRLHDDVQHELSWDVGTCHD